MELNEEEIAEIDQVLATCGVGDDRYHPDGMKSINGKSPPISFARMSNTGCKDPFSQL